MIRVNFNRFVNLLLITLSLTIVGCSEAPKEQLTLSQDTSSQPIQNNSDVKRHPYKFNKTASNHKNTVWERLILLYALPEIDNPRVDRELYWYLEHPASLAIIQQRAEPYLNHILDEIEAKNIPGEFALLPVVESAFVPDAYSKADASGLWQFVPSTGKEYGLEQNDWYDGRRDIFDSTKAATSYLKELSEDFNGDWLLALASYNCGKGRVRKSIDKNTNLNLPTDYWSLDLPEETEDYVPRLLAIAKIFAHADEYNIHLQHIPNRPYFEVIDIHSPLDLHKAAELAHTSLPIIKKLNPGFNRKSTAPQGPHRLLVPVDRAQVFKENLALLPFTERVTTQYYEEPVVERRSQEKHQEVTSQANEKIDKSSTTIHKVKSGESLESIARNNDTTTKLLRTTNLLKNDVIRSGMQLQIPQENKSNTKPTVVALVDSKVTLADKSQKVKAPSTQSYEIKKGDTFYNISQRFTVTPKDLANWNNLSLGTALIPGKKLTIKTSANAQVASTSSIRLVSYTVGKNDSLIQISKKFNVSVADLRKANATTLVKGLTPGQKLKIFVDNNSFSS
ncbi:MAG: LysM peptidoglycan-binding domain-containing protein [Methylococcales bacterium]